MGYLQNMTESSRLVFDEFFLPYLLLVAKATLGAWGEEVGGMGEWVGDFSERNRGVQQIDRVSERRHREYVLWNGQAPAHYVMYNNKPRARPFHSTKKAGELPEEQCSLWWLIQLEEFCLKDGWM